MSQVSWESSEVTVRSLLKSTGHRRSACVVKDAALAASETSDTHPSCIAVENGGEFRHLDMGDTMRVNRSRR